MCSDYSVALKPAMRALRRSWLLLVTATAGFLLLGYLGLRTLWDPESAQRWLLLAGAISMYELAVLFRRLPLNRRPGHPELLQELGQGTLATIIRGLMLAGVAGFAFSPRPTASLAWAPMALFTLAESLDYVDGYLARRTDHVTQLGESLDLEFDSLGMLVGSGLAVWYGVLPWPFLSIGAASYLFQFGIWVRDRADKRVRDLPPSSSRRPIAGLMMGYLSVMLWPIVGPPASVFAGLFFLIPFLASFVRDWLVVSDVVDAGSKRYARWRARAKTILLAWVPLPIRVLLMLAIIRQISRDPIEGGIPQFLMIVLGAVIGLGIAGRAAAFVLLFPVGLSIAFEGFETASALVLGSTLSILFLGTGKYSLWQPEASLFSRRAGE